MKNLKLISKFNILLDLVDYYGPGFLFQQRAHEIYLRSPMEISKLRPEMKGALYHVYEEMRTLGILSEPKAIKRLPRPYPLMKPQKFKEYILKDLIMRMGQPNSYTFPLSLRNQAPETVIQRLAAVLGQKGKKAPNALALMHSAYLFESAVYEKAKIFRGRSPICLLLDGSSRELLEIEIGIKRIRLQRSKAEGARAFLSFPENHDQTDLVLFEKNGLEEFSHSFGEISNLPKPIQPIHPVVNLLLLPFYPVRGLEASERLAEIIQSEFLAKEKRP